MKFLANVDLAGNELRTAVIEVRTSDPSPGRVGQVYFNSAASKLRVCTVAGSPGTWKDVLNGPIGSGDITDGSIVNADVSPTAAIALTKLATDPLARANHTGTQTTATISDFVTQRDAQRLDQHAAPTGPVDLNNKNLANVADPVAPTDGANKRYVDNAVSGFDWKPSVRAATTANIASLGTFGGLVDGVTLAGEDRVLVKNQTNPAENGIYRYISIASALSRAGEADTWDELVGAAVIVEQGATNADTAWLCTVDQGGTLGTTAVTFTQFPGAGSIVAGSGLTRTGNQLDVGAGAGISVAADTVAIDTAVVGRKARAQITGDGTATSFTVTHSWALAAPITTLVQVYDDATGTQVEADVTQGTNVVTIAFGTAPAVGVKYNVIVVG